MDNKFFELGANEQPLDIIKETCGFAGVFKQIGVIGDSLASGEFESHDENGSIVYTDMYEYSWPAVLERITGTKYNNYSRGGMTAREYIQSWADEKDFGNGIKRISLRWATTIRLSSDIRWEASRTLTQNVRRITPIRSSAIWAKSFANLKRSSQMRVFLSLLRNFAVMPAIKIFVISQANLPNCAICLTLRTCWI